MRHSLKSQNKVSSNRADFKKRFQPYILLLPLFIVVALLFGYPIYRIISGSFFKIAIINGEMNFVGLENFKKVFSAKFFLPTLSLTFRYAVVTVFLKLSLGFIMALFMNSDMYFSKFLKFMSLLPWAMQQVAVAVIWKWILDGNYGYLNFYLQKLGFIHENISFLSNPGMAFFAASFVDTWLGLPMVSMIFMAGLSNINSSLYESAKIDGAGIISRFFHITCPCIKRVFLVTLTLVGIWTFNSFNVIFVLTGGGPM
ncbi:MAG: sugar ABC transporter permease, partial [Lachnoanaerobaculum sp.]|nr:sugar ABC transporter permease [Lachnoanaerobaculum sp.]